MADIFISYSKDDRDHVVQLAAMLEAEGWSVWWDTSLLSGDDFRDVIMRELGRARAIVVLWTETSTKSDWVRSEAGRAQADRNLIPLKLSHLGYKDLPPPFDVLHTENIDNGAAIKAAIVAHLAKPEITPSLLWLTSKDVRYQALTWFGIVGGALTLFSGLSSLLQLADWARWVVGHWKEWTNIVWITVIEWFGFKVPSHWAPVATCSTFFIMIAVGQRLATTRSIGEHRAAIPLGRLWGIPAILALGYMITTIADRYPDRYPAWDVFVLIVLCLLALSPALLARDRPVALAVMILGISAVFVLAIEPLFSLPIEFGRSGNELGIEAAGIISMFILAWMLPATALALAPARELFRRLTFLAIGVVLLSGLSWLSTLGLTLPKPPAN